MAINIVVKRNNLPSIAARLPIASTAIVGKRGAEMVEIAQRLSRIDTGAMRDGWRFETRGTGIGGALTNDTPHTVHNEYGTVHMSAAPMARPAAEQVFPKIIEDFRNLSSEIT